MFRRNVRDTNKDEKSKLSRFQMQKIMPSVHVKPNSIKATAIVLGLMGIFILWHYLRQSNEVRPPGAELMPNLEVPHRRPGSLSPEEIDALLDRIISENKEFIHDNEKEGQLENQIPLLQGVYNSTGGLTFAHGKFYLAGKPFRILSGAMHYFRVHPKQWKDRMLKMKACGLNTLETYVSWNLHERLPGEFDFGGILNIRKYISLAHSLGLKVILRPGPYICSEWDFGGLPAWLLKDPHMKVRSNYPGYMQAVERFFNKLLPLVADQQYSRGGPIIGVQVENEFGSFSKEVAHLRFIKQLLIKNGIKELLFTSDGWVRMEGGDRLGIANVPFYNESMPSLNFKETIKGQKAVSQLRKISSEFPILVMEFWTGWFDHWGNRHAYSTVKEYAETLMWILSSGASVNLYMFHGGTNFGFMAGANWSPGTNYKPDVTSYDYISPVSEAGDLTDKYHVTRKLIMKHVLEPEGLPVPSVPPPETTKEAYGILPIRDMMTLDDMLPTLKKVTLDHPVSMEMLDINNGYGQNYGYILYRGYILHGRKLKFTTLPADRAQVIINGKEISVLDWKSTENNLEINIPQDYLSAENILDILVENHGRVNFAPFGTNILNTQRKGLSGDVELDGKPILKWNIFSLDFTNSIIESASQSGKWKPHIYGSHPATLCRTELNILGNPADTFLSMQGWQKGIVLINGFNIGRYWNRGPQQTLYVPGPVLKSGKNQILIFEQHVPGKQIAFQSEPILSKLKEI
ncbi:hypothetical protein ACJMK2_027262 [Sinanodonta woodiana]|uniref:Beta-galactosidase n=1 Tax=Sinanodonta woodiana TaxID=1069815 RepID=A0ABD3XQQ0_SINWO